MAIARFIMTLPGRGLRREHGSKPAALTPIQLEQDFDLGAPNQTWVTDINYIRTHEG